MMRAKSVMKGRQGVERNTRDLSYVTWQTGEAIALPIGAVQARGDALPHVRSPERLAAVGDLTAQVSHVQALIVEALADALRGMELAAEELDRRRDDIASMTLVAANMKLAAAGVALLELRIVAMNWDDG